MDQAKNSRDAQEWKRAEVIELENLNKNKTWKLVEKPEDKTIVELKWV